jgi:Family of unknown function (DUF6526)
MAEKQPQTYANHTRFDPLFHFFALPVFAITVIGEAVVFLMHPSVPTGWVFVVSVAAAVLVVKFRFYALKNQDRIIRLEERLRLATLLPEPLRARIGELTEGQLVAIRFACDADVPGCVERALSGQTARKDIKNSIQTWRPDYFRV